MEPKIKPQPSEPNPNPIDPGVTIGHVHMKTSDLSVIEKFYVAILGFSVVARYPGAIFLAAGNYHHHLAFNTWESKGGQPAPINSTGLYHIAIKYPTRKALAEALKRLNEASWPLDGLNDHGTQQALYLHDPEHNGLELYWDRPESEWPVDEAGNIKFESKSFELNSLLAELD